jgi:formylglycine-generating enzyme required for sulfatase activity
VVLDWIEVAGGTFWMGGGKSADTRPRHRVTLSPFRLARTPVTRQQYQRFLDATGHEAPGFWNEAAFAHATAPAAGPSWLDAMAYCEWLRHSEGLEVGLPSEAQWEMAALAGREVVYPWGDGGPEAVIDYDKRWLEGPEPVDLYPSRHPLGFVGLGENVHEWCSDWYAADYYEASPELDPPGPPEGRRRASRGGSWRHAIKVTPCAARSSIPPDKRYADYGFRVVRAADGA